MPGPDFHQTVMGVRFFERDVPRILEQLARLNANLEALVAELRHHRGGTTPASTTSPPERG